MRPSPDELLRSMRETLTTLIIPNVADDWARYAAKAMEKIILHLELRWLHELTLLTLDTVELDELLRAVQNDLAGFGERSELTGACTAIGDRLRDGPPPAEAPDVTGVSARNEAYRATLAEVIGRLERAADAPDLREGLEPVRERIRAYLRRELDRDVELTAPTFMSFGPPPKSPAAAECDALDGGRVEAYLRERMPDRAGLRLAALSRSVGGMSRETWFADVEWEDGGAAASQRLTIRLDHPEGSVVPRPLWWEYRVLQGLYGSAVPVAEPLWYEEDERLLGRAPFYVRDNVPGDASPKHLHAPGTEERRASIGRDFARALAHVHTFDWREGGLAEFMDVPELGRDCALQTLARIRGHYERTAAEPSPVMAELFAWLERNAPTEVVRVSLIWGDVGVGNFIYADDRVVALTDWEQAHLGDPMKDIASALWRGVEGLIDRDELFAIYEETSGIPVREESIAYYTTFMNVESTCNSHAVVRAFSERTPEITFARLGLGIPFSCQDLALRSIGY